LPHQPAAQQRFRGFACPRGRSPSSPR
jgi:hypothetical protein